MALSAAGNMPDFTLEAIPPTQSLPLAASGIVYSGGLIGVNSSGFVSDVTGLDPTVIVAGVSLSTYATPGAAAGSQEILYQQAKFSLINATGNDQIQNANIPCIVYAKDDQTVALTDGGGTRPIAGIAVGVQNTTGFYVYVDVRLEQNQQLQAMRSSFSGSSERIAWASATSLAAYTASGGVLTANANGALGAQDGITLTAGKILFVPPAAAAAAADAGLYTVSVVGDGSTKWVLTRAAGWATGLVSGGQTIRIAFGEQLQGQVFQISNTGAITVGTTAITFNLVPQPVPVNSGAANRASYFVRGTWNAPGSGAQDVEVIATGDLPTKLRVLDTMICISNAGAATGTATLRTATAGGGSALSGDLDTASTGRARDDSTATSTVASSAGLYLRLTDGTTVGEVIITVAPEQ